MSAPSSRRASDSASEFRANSLGHDNTVKAFGNAQLTSELIAVLQALLTLASGWLPTVLAHLLAERRCREYAVTKTCQIRRSSFCSPARGVAAP